MSAPVLVIGAVFLFRPEWITALLAWWSPDVLYSIETREPLLAITIDDGPDAVSMLRILDVLRQNDARATFFLVSDRVAGNEALVARAVDEGHELANHLTADEPSILLSPSEFERQLLEAHEVLSAFGDVRWYRPGSGWYNTTMLSSLRRHNYHCVLGSIYPFDPQIPSAWFATRYILWNARPGSIIILHDYGTRGERTAQVLATVLPELDRRGFRFVTLSDLVGSTLLEE